MSSPAIVLIGPEHPDELLGAFARYQHEYDVRLVRSCRDALETTRDILDGGATVALYATESVVPDAESVLHAFHKLREKVPTARRVIAAHWDRFIIDAPPLRAGMAVGKYDAFLLMPRGTRDEEFHNAITDLLSDWGSTVPDPAPRRRPRGGRRRTGRARGRRLRRVRGALDGDPRGRGDRRPGRHQLDDPQLPRLPARHLRHAPRPARPQPGPALRRPLLHRPGRRRAAARPRRRSPCAVHRDRRGAGPFGGDRQRCRLPQAAGRPARGARRDRRLLRRGDDRGPRDGGTGRLRGRRRQLRRAGRHAPGPVRAVGDDPGAPAVPGRDDVVVPGQRDRVQQPGVGAHLHRGRRRRRRRRPAGVACLEDTRTGERERVSAYGLFLLLGAEPHCDWIPPSVARDARGFVLTGRDVPREHWLDGVPPADLATTVPGVFCAGDVRAGSMKRVASASGEGASVVPLVHAYLAPEGS